MSEELQKPEEPCRTHAGNIVVDDQVAVGIDTLCLNQVLNDPEKAIQRLLSRINKADAEDVEAPRPGDMAVRVGFGRSKVHQNEVRIAEVTSEVLHRP